MGLGRKKRRRTIKRRVKRTIRGRGIMDTIREKFNGLSAGKKIGAIALGSLAMPLAGMFMK